MFWTKILSYFYSTIKIEDIKECRVVSNTEFRFITEDRVFELKAKEYEIFIFTKMLFNPSFISISRDERDYWVNGLRKYIKTTVWIEPQRILKHDILVITYISKITKLY